MNEKSTPSCNREQRQPSHSRRLGWIGSISLNPDPSPASSVAFSSPRSPKETAPKESRNTQNVSKCEQKCNSGNGADDQSRSEPAKTCWCTIGICHLKEALPLEGDEVGFEEFEQPGSRRLSVGNGGNGRQRRHWSVRHTDRPARVRPDGSTSWMEKMARDCPEIRYTPDKTRNWGEEI